MIEIYCEKCKDWHDIEFWICSICGRHFCNEDGLYLSEGVYICEECEKCELKKVIST